METVYFPVACTIAFAHSGIRRIAAKSLHSFKIQKFGTKTVNLTAPDGTIAYGVWCDYFERLPAGYTWVKFKESRCLSTGKRRVPSVGWDWGNAKYVTFEAGGVYAVKMLPSDEGQTDSCNFKTKDRKIFPYVDRGYFSVVSEIRNSALPRVLEAFPLPVPGVRRDHDPDCWDAPTEYDSIPVITEGFPSYSFRHPTTQPVAALRLEFDDDKNPVYRCSYFGPALK